MNFLRPLLAFATAFTLAGCHAKKASDPDSLPPVAVRTVVVESKPRASSEEVVGTVRASLRAVLEAKLSARIEALLVAPGQAVKAGDLLAQLDAREVQAKLDQALALREQATRDLARARDLLDKKVTTQAEFDSVQARERVASGSAREMETMLGYTKILAPFNGVITRKLADVGDLAAPSKPILEMENPRALRFEADVPESLIGSVKLGTKLPVRVSAVAAPVEGTVVEIAPIAEAASRTFIVKLDLPAAEDTRSGQFGRVWVVTGESPSIRVPATALVVRGQMEYIFVAENQRAQLRLVRAGKRTDGEIEILAGLNSGETVVIEGAAQLRDGQSITLKP